MAPPRLSRIEKGFRLHDLTTELAVEIIRFAATPDFSDSSTNPYSNALALCLVSNNARHEAIQSLLHTVVLSNSLHVQAFIRAILIQRQYKAKQSRLEVDYTVHIKRMWCGTCWEALVDEPTDSPAWLDYGVLWEVMRNVESLGIHSRSYHLLYNGLATERMDAMDVDSGTGSANHAAAWRCQKITLAGDPWRWKPLTSTAEGTAFLSQITHLMLWFPDNHRPPVERSRLGPEELPVWMHDVPFEMMQSLTDFGFVFSTKAPKQMLAYHFPREGHSGEPSTTRNHFDNGWSSIKILLAVA